MPTQHFIIEGKHLGTAERTPRFVHAEVHNPVGYAFFCPCCGDVWARCPVEDQPWTVWTKPCRKHSTSALDIPGSLWLSWDKEFSLALPQEVLRWELERHLDHMEQGS
jgi:hypothetical protein